MNQTELRYTLFWHQNEGNGRLSNWYPRPFVVEGVQYAHVEQYMMAEKAKLFHDTERWNAIMETDDPLQCRRLGRAVTPFDPVVWDACCHKVVKDGSRAKYEQNPDLMQFLLSTGDTIIAEASPRDRKWGIGLGEKRAAQMEPEEWRGKNLLGKILMELREEFRNRAESEG